MIIHICSNSNTLTLFYFLKISLRIISIIVPLLLMYKVIKILSKTVTSGNDLSKEIGNIMKSTIASLIIFFLPTLINSIFDMIGNYSNKEIVSCYQEANLNSIKSLKAKEEKEQQERIKKREEEAKRIAEEAAKKRKEENDKKKKPTSSSSEGSTSESTNSASASNLKQQISNYLSSKQGDWSVYIINLKNNETVDINGTKQMVAASTIKLFIMEYLYNLAANNQTNTESFEQLVSPMIKNSDNSATNQLIDMYGMNNINSYIINKYSNSTLQRKMLTSGNENYTSAADLARLLKDIYNGNLINQQYSSRMLNYLKGQTRRSKIPAGVPSNAVVANKTGENVGVQNDAAIVYSNNCDYIIVVLGNSINDEGSGISTIKEVSSLVYNFYNK